MAGKDVYVVGGANSAGQAALHLARFARRVTLVVRAESLDAGMSHYLVQQLQATPNVEVRTGTEVVGGGGDGRLQHLVLRDRDRRRAETVAADGLFVLIGARPHTDWLPGRDRQGPGRLPADRRGRRRRSRMAARPAALLAGDEHARGVRRRRRAARIGQAGRLRRRRGLDRDPARAQASRGRGDRRRSALQRDACRVGPLARWAPRASASAARAPRRPRDRRRSARPPSPVPAATAR